ncbi:MAG: type IX secretion system membrane protein PorP/SprF [Bacteroidales bacterium]
MKHRVFIAKALALGLALGFTLPMNAQEVPARPLSIPVYHPMVFNPAVVGSKDFTSVSLTSKVLNSPQNQLLQFHTRFGQHPSGFSPWGLGSYVFRNNPGTEWETGASVAAAYHIPLDENYLHMISVGSSFRGFFHLPGKTLKEVYNDPGRVFQLNMDLGVYYYGPRAFGGLSSTSLFGGKWDAVLPGDSSLFFPRGYHAFGGYKFMIKRDPGIVLEPSLLISVSDSTLGEFHRHMVPYLKLYLQNFYVGTGIKPLQFPNFWKSMDVIVFFFQYQFPRMHTGVYLEFPRTGFLNDNNIIFEVNLGFNLGKEGEGFFKYRHW